MNIALDEYGNPVLLLEEQQQKKRLKGLEAHKLNILAAKAVSDTLQSSLGPKGMDKIVVGADGQVTVTNDGATILEKMEVEHQCAKLLVNLSKSQDDEVGDGTTGVVILAGGLLEQSLKLLQRGLHPLRIADGYEMACQIALKRVEEIAEDKSKEIEELRNNPSAIAGKDLLVRAAMTALGSKVVSSQQKKLAQVAVEAVQAVADFGRRDVNFDMIKVEGKASGRLEDTKLVNGVVISKELSHSQMKKEIKDAKIAILTCPFEPPKPKTKHKLNIKSVEDFKSLQAAEQNYFLDMVKRVKDSGANFVICQWGFDDEANHLLLQNDLPSVRWVGGVELELIAIATGAKIVPRFEELTAGKLGRAGSIKEVSSGTEGDKVLVIEDCKNSKTVTLLVHATNKVVVAEAERCMHDALCCVRNLIRSPKVVAGGGSTEIACAIAVEAAADGVASSAQVALRAFAEALLTLPSALASNAGLDTINSVTDAKAQQIQTGNPYIGIDCMQMGTCDMMKQEVYESLASKLHQIALATQVVKMILKVDDVIAPSDKVAVEGVKRSTAYGLG